MLDLVKQATFAAVHNKRFNFMTDFDIEVEPGVIWDDLNTFNCDHYDERLNIEKVDGKHIVISLKSEDPAQ